MVQTFRTRTHFLVVGYSGDLNSANGSIVHLAGSLPVLPSRWVLLVAEGTNPFDNEVSSGEGTFGPRISFYSIGNFTI